MKLNQFMYGMTKSLLLLSTFIPVSLSRIKSEFFICQWSVPNHCPIIFDSMQVLVTWTDFDFILNICWCYFKTGPMFLRSVVKGWHGSWPQSGKCFTGFTWKTDKQGKFFCCRPGNLVTDYHAIIFMSSMKRCQFVISP